MSSNKRFRDERYPGLSSWAQTVITDVIIRRQGRITHRRIVSQIMEAERSREKGSGGGAGEGGMLSLKMEKGARSQGMQLQKPEKARKWVLP